MNTIKIGNGISKPFIIGSNCFFKGMEGFEAHDNDVLYLVDEPIMFKTVMNLKGRGDDVFYWKKMTPDEYVDYILSHDNAMQIGKFLNKEVSDYLGFTIEDLKKLQPILSKLKDKHKYEAVIFNSYIENNDFYMTDKQLKEAYKEYLKYK